jgi:tRNA-Thr(GGU) m(6)t(6)A37 methyltransferase TsaA
MKYDVTPIAFVHSCYKEKFATPRQSGIVTAATGVIELVPPFNDPDSVAGLENCSHIWLQFIFDKCINQGWKAKVRPPRLGGNKKMGVFATRATHRPNAIGMSAVKLERIETGNSKVLLYVSGLDLIDGTPIIDIKPYIPYSDSIEDAQYPFAQAAPSEIRVHYCSAALETKT